MKDLYRSLGLDGPVEISESLGDAIESCTGSDLAHTAQYVLLDPKRKKVYDATYCALATIETLDSALATLSTDEPAAQTPAATACADQEADAPAQMTESLDDLMDQFGVPDEPIARRLEKRALPVPIRHIQIAAVATASICIIVIVFSTIFSETDVIPFPKNGLQQGRAVGSNESKVKVVSPEGGGHGVVEFISDLDGHLALMVFVRDGQDCSVGIPAGKYTVRMSVGREEQWDGRTFKRVLREIEPLVMSIEKGKTKTLKIP